MKPYGATKYDTATCAYGCCGGDLRPGICSGKNTGKNKRAARIARKRARHEARNELHELENSY